MDKNAKIYIAGHNGMVGSAIKRNLESKGYNNIVTRSFSELNLLSEKQVIDFFDAEQPEYVVLAAGSSVEMGGRFLYYATGAAADFQNKNTIMEGEYFKSHFNVFGVNIENHLRLAEADTVRVEKLARDVMLIGNSWTRKTFHNKNVVGLLNGMYLPASLVMGVSIKNNGILWIGSKGIIHKGLHIAAEVAIKSYSVLYVVGVSDVERDLAKFILDKTGCKYVMFGYISVGGSLWGEIVEKCYCVLGCSVSEGMSTGLLTAISAGLFPISTDSCGINYGPIVNFEDRSTLVDRIINIIDIIKSKSGEYNDLRLDISKRVSVECSENNFSLSVGEVFFKYMVDYAAN